MILRPTNGPLDWREFLAKPDLHWKAGKSAMETAYSWESQAGLPPCIARIFPNSDLLFAIPEYKVALPGGARESQNDVFALLSDAKGLIACMVEAKRDEPFGPTLKEWLQGASSGKRTRLSALCAILGLEIERLNGGLRYQLFHRTVSAILTAQRFHSQRAAMVVQSFSPENHWFEDYAEFLSLFGLVAIKNGLACGTMPEGIEVSFGWASCEVMEK